MNPSRVCCVTLQVCQGLQIQGGRNLCISSAAWKAVCGKPNPTHLPSCFGQCRNPRVRWWGVKVQCQGLGQQGTLTCGQKALVLSCSSVMVLQRSWLP